MQPESHNLEKEFLFTDRDFYYLSRLVSDRVGIDLPDTKRELVYGRLAKRLRLLGLRNFKEYCAILDSGNDTEFTNFINAITTNVTSFFRENHHFEFLQNSFFPELTAKHKTGRRQRLRIWSAGCSSGKEPYSIAMVLKECISDLSGWDAKILATDLDSSILDVAQKGIYPADSLNEVNQWRQKRWFRNGAGTNQGMTKVNDELKEIVSFRKLNLMDAWPMSGKFDIIFCRNVTIYFDKQTRINIIDRFANMLSDGGYLFVGHSESMFGLTRRFDSVGRTIHRKIA